MLYGKGGLLSEDLVKLRIVMILLHQANRESKTQDGIPSERTNAARRYKGYSPGCGTFTVC
jgi:hypothetical protein